MAKLTIPQVVGAYPALDRKQVQKPFVVEGKNYVVDLEGPRSAFGYQTPHDRFIPSYLMQSFEIGSEIFYFARDTDETFLQVSTVSWPDKQVIPIGKFVSADLLRPKLALPWTHAFVGTYHYFANRTWGVLRYDAINQIWEDVTATIGVSNIFFICESDGRLCTLAEGLVSWSAIDNGLDNTPSLATGAGFQALSKIGTIDKNTDYLGIQKVSTGFLAFTTKGVLRNEIIDSVSPFRHLPGESHHQPINPWCLTKLSDTEVIMLSRFGLFVSSDGIEFEEYQPIMGEFFKTVEIPPLLSLDNGFVLLYYSQARDELYCSFAQSQVASQYTKAWVLYLKRQEWGSFNRVHRGFVYMDPDAIGVNYQQAFIDSVGRICYLNDLTVSLAAEPQNLHAVYTQPTLEYPTYAIEDVWQMRTNCRMAGFSEVGFPAIAGWYEEFGALATYITENLDTSIASYATDVAMWYSDLATATSGVVTHDYVPNVQLVNGSTYEYKIKLRAGFSTGVCRINLYATTLSIGINWVIGTTAFGIVGAAILSNIAIVDEGDSNYTFTITFTEDGTISAIQSMQIAPGFILPTNLGSVGFREEGLYKDGAATSILPAPAVAYASIVYVENFMETVAHTDSALIVLGKVAQALSEYSLDSYIEIGLFRFTAEVANDELSLITNVAISCLNSTESTGTVLDDWLNDYPADIAEDWLAISPDVFEDWGTSVASGSTYTQKIRGTLDGYVTFEDQFVDIEEVLIDGKTKFCSCENQGIFETVRLDATQVGESFHVKTLEFNGNVAGRL